MTIFRNPTIFHVLCEFYGYFQNRFLSWKGKVIDGIEENITELESEREKWILKLPFLCSHELMEA